MPVDASNNSISTTVSALNQADSTQSLEETPTLARPHHGPKDFARILRALLTLLKASPKPSGPRFRTSYRQIRKEGLAPTTKQPEATPQQRPVLKHRYKRELFQLWFPRPCDKLKGLGFCEALQGLERP